MSHLNPPALSPSESRSERTATPFGVAGNRGDPRLVMVLSVLLEAHACAEQQHDWEYAVEIAQLHSLGINNSQLRWLVREQLVEHQVEYTSPRFSRRCFHAAQNLAFSNRTCFLLTKKGVTLIRSAVANVPADGGGEADVGNLLAAGSAARTPSRPSFDAATRLLFLGNQVVKQFKVPAANQELILLAFEEEQWTTHIDDPLPPVREIDPKKRLHDAICRLNSNQKARLIKFEGDGTGRGVNWRRIDDRSAVANRTEQG